MRPPVGRTEKAPWALLGWEKTISREEAGVTCGSVAIHTCDITKWCTGSYVVQTVITPGAFDISTQIVLWGNLQAFTAGNFSDSFLPEPGVPISVCPSPCLAGPHLPCTLTAPALKHNCWGQSLLAWEVGLGGGEQLAAGRRNPAHSIHGAHAESQGRKETGTRALHRLGPACSRTPCLGAAGGRQGPGETLHFAVHSPPLSPSLLGFSSRCLCHLPQTALSPPTPCAPLPLSPLTPGALLTCFNPQC